MPGHHMVLGWPLDRVALEGFGEMEWKWKSPRSPLTAGSAGQLSPFPRPPRRKPQGCPLGVLVCW